MVESKQGEEVESYEPIDSHSDDFDEDYTYKRKMLSSKKKGISKQIKPYPTKNFLPTFRSSFLDFLKQFFNADFF